MIFNRHEFVKQTVKVGFKNSIKTTGYKSVKVEPLPSSDKINQNCLKPSDTFTPCNQRIS